MENRNSKNQFVRGWSWGEIKVKENDIEFESNNQPWFSIPYSGISNVLLPTKNEIGIEFNVEEDQNPTEDMLCEMRLYVPNKANENQDEEKSEMEDGEKSENNEENKHSAQLIRDEILKSSNIVTLGEAIAVVTEIPMITPRGKFDLHMLKNYLKIHGPSHDYKILYKNINKVFLLPKPDGIHIAFVVGLNNPLRQGNTTYPFLVFQLKNKMEKTVDLNLPEDPQERKAILKDDISGSISGETYDILAKLFKALLGIGVIIPKNFKSAKGKMAIKCSLKANEGYLYPLERSLIFIHKPVVFISHEDIKVVECERVTEKSVDLVIQTKKEDIQLIGIERSEYEPLIGYFTNKKIKVKGTDEEEITEVKASNVTTSRRQKKLEETPMELPSDESLFDEDYHSSGGGSDMDVDNDDSDGGKKKKNKDKKEKKRKHK